MATPRSDSLLSHAKARQAELYACSRCKGLLVNQPTNAVLLPCLHSLCAACFQGAIVPRSGKVICAECKLQFPATAVVRHHLLAATNRRALRCQASSCPDRLAAVAFCEFCKEALCSGCLSAHRRVTATREHRLVAIGSAAPPTPNCARHADERVQLLCHCGELTCRSCQLGEHAAHGGYKSMDVRLRAPSCSQHNRCLQAAANDVRAQLADVQKQNKHKLVQLNNTLSVIQNRVQQVGKARDGSLALLGQTIRRIHEQLLLRGRQLQTVITDISAKKVAEYGKLQADIQSISAKLDRAQMFIDEVLSLEDSAAALKTHRSVCRFMASVPGLDEASFNGLQTAPQLQLVLPAVQLTQMAQSISVLGSVSSWPPHDAPSSSTAAATATGVSPQQSVVAHASSSSSDTSASIGNGFGPPPLHRLAAPPSHTAAAAGPSGAQPVGPSPQIRRLLDCPRPKVTSPPCLTVSPEPCCTPILPRPSPSVSGNSQPHAAASPQSDQCTISCSATTIGSERSPASARKTLRPGGRLNEIVSKMQSSLERSQASGGESSVRPPVGLRIKRLDDGRLSAAPTDANSCAVDVDRWEDYCSVCQQGCDETTGLLGCCARCPKVYHARCHVPAIRGVVQDLPDDWVCGLCQMVEPLTQRPKRQVVGEAKVELSDVERRACERVLLEMYCCGYSTPFHNPVRRAEAPTYYLIIRQPMDLTTIRRRLRGGQQRFGGVDEFVRAANRVCKNCATFNPPDSDVGKFGVKLSEALRAAVQTHMPAYAADVWQFESRYSAADHDLNALDLQPDGAPSPKRARYLSSDDDA